MRVLQLCSDIPTPREDGPDALVHRRFLCRGCGLLLAGATGVGKSTLALQLSMCWACGQAFAGMEPARPLKSLIIQAENDDGDIAEMRDGILPGVVDHDETGDLWDKVNENVIVVQDCHKTGHQLVDKVIKPLVKERKPDLLWLDPAFAYFTGSVNEQKDVSIFLRQQLNPVAMELGLGLVLVHHTNKPTTEQNRPQAGYAAYLGAGSAEFANWARAVLAILPHEEEYTYKLICGKRFQRLGWQTRLICQNRSSIIWQDLGVY